MHRITVHTYPNTVKQSCYEQIFGETCIIYTAKERSDMRLQLLSMIARIGIESAVARVVGSMWAENNDMEQAEADSLYNAVLWLHKLVSENN